MNEDTSNNTSPTAAAPDWPLKVRQSVAMVALEVSVKQLFALKLRRRKVGNTTFYDPDQIGALLALRNHWLRTAR
jgi:hypothetical protein